MKRDPFLWFTNGALAVLVGVVAFLVVALVLHYTGHWPDGPHFARCR